MVNISCVTSQQLIYLKLCGQAWNLRLEEKKKVLLQKNLRFLSFLSVSIISPTRFTQKSRSLATDSLLLTSSEETYACQDKLETFPRQQYSRIYMATFQHVWRHSPAHKRADNVANRSRNIFNLTWCRSDSINAPGDIFIPFVEIFFLSRLFLDFKLTSKFENFRSNFIEFRFRILLMWCHNE